MDFLVTGGAGFIGSHIVKHLVSTGRSVRILDNLSTGNEANLKTVSGRIEFIHGDIRDRNTANRACIGVDSVLHLAALPSVAESVDNPAEAHEVNSTGTLHMLLAARDARARRFVFSSSCAVYGDSPVSPKTENIAPDPLSPYAAQKAAGEQYCRIFHRLYGLPAFALRYFNVYGPGQNPASQYAAAVPIFVKKLRDNQPPTIHGDGLQTRDFVFVRDVVLANLACCQADDSRAGNVVNIASGRSVSIVQLVQTLLQLLHSPVKPLHTPARQGDIRESSADISAAARLLNWKPLTTLEQGLREILES